MTGTRGIRRRAGFALAALTLAVGTAWAGAVPATAAPPPDTSSAATLADGGSVTGTGEVIEPRVDRVAGIDVSGHQGDVNWQAVWDQGARFAYVKATEGTTFRNPNHAQQYNGSYNVGMIRGSYHFALPDRSSGAAQAQFFVNSGGAWSADGKTLPGALDIEYNPYGSTCFGLSQASMRAWIADFSNTYNSLTGRYPSIYTTTDWWSTCTGNTAAHGSTNPLWIARYSSSPGALPAGWGFHTIWQYSSTGPFPGDSNWFNGAYDRLEALARG